MSTNPNAQSGTLHYPQGRGHGTGRRPLSMLPAWYAQAIGKPTPRIFSQAAEYARWNLIWPQLLILILLPLILGGIRLLFGGTAGNVNPNSNILFGAINILTIGISFGATIIKAFFVPIVFFIVATLQYVIAHIFGGRGRYRQQCFAMLLYQLPLTLISTAIIAVLVILHISTFIISPILAIVFFCYSIIINIVAVSGVHNISQNKAIATVLVPYILGIILLSVAVSAIAHTLFNVAHP
jgi:Yip1 domain.